MRNTDSYSDVTDSGLVAGAAAGDRGAFGALVARHQAAACGVAYSVCGDFHVSEDVAQEAFVSAWRELASLREADRFRPWVCGIARNIALDRVRKTARRGDYAPEGEPRDEADDAASPAEGAIAAEESTLVWQTIDGLEDSYREPLVLFYREQQSVAAVATAMELSEGVVKQRLSRGREMLREELARRIEGVLVRTRPSTVFTAGVMAALPPILAGAGLALAAGSAKAATIGGTGNAAASGGMTGALPVAATAVSGAVGLLSLYVLFRYLRAPEIPKEIRRTVGRTVLYTLGLSVAFALFILWVALTRGAPLASCGIPPMLALAVGVFVFIAAIVALSFRASALLRRHSPPKTLCRNAYCRRYASKGRFLGLPLVSLAFGPDPEKGERHGTARGWFAMGDVAYGFISLGGVAVGPVALGGLSVGILSLGGFTLGILSLGGVAVGWTGCGGIALAWELAIGGLAVAHNLAVGGLALASVQAMGGVALAPLSNDPSTWTVLKDGTTWPGLMMKILPHMSWLSLLGLPGLYYALRYFHGKKRPVKV